jgi:long-chain acyl-CoA synthetase
MNTCVLLGGTMSLVPRFEAAAVLDVVQRNRATVFEGVPTMFVALLQAPGLASYDLSSLRAAISEGTAPVQDPPGPPRGVRRRSSCR